MSVMSILDDIRRLQARIREDAAALASSMAGICDRKEAMLARAGKAAAPEVRSQLAASLAASGVASRTGTLASAVRRADVRATARGLTARLPAGLDPRVYVYAGAIQHGSVRGAGGRSLKRALKRNYVSAGGVGAIIAARPFFAIGPGGAAAISSAVSAEMQRQVEAP